MELIRTRNAQQSLSAIIPLLYSSGEESGSDLLLDAPVMFEWERPRERMTFWPSFRRNPAHELAQSLQALRTAEAAIPDAARAVLAGKHHFLFSTPAVAIQGSIGTDGRLHLRCVTTERNPMAGALGQLGFQLTMLHELIANEAKRNLGTFSILQLGIQLPVDAVRTMFLAGADVLGYDPYTSGETKARSIDSPLDMGVLLDQGEKAIGYRSKWGRHVALPLFATQKLAMGGDWYGARIAAKLIKADDYRTSMLDWLEAAQAAQEAQSGSPQA